ncbi:hypothetical protein Ancab_039050 [Ancistrocladus abbreviatus]
MERSGSKLPGAGGSSASSAKLDRKTVERNRRIQMKGLCFGLTSLIPPHHFKPSKEMLSQHDQLEQATSYITQLRERVEQLKRKKEEAMSSNKRAKHNQVQDDRKAATEDMPLPVIKLRDFGSCLEFVLISGLQKRFMLYEVISVLQEEGAEVVSVNFSTSGNKVFHTLHAQVKSSRVGIEISRICERLHELAS